MRFGNVWPMGKKYNIRYLELARSDLLGIAEYVNSQALERDAANRLVDSLEKALLRLESFPYSGALYGKSFGFKEEHRMLVVGNYLVFYVVYDDFVEIRRVIHGKRRFLDLLQPSS